MRAGRSAAVLVMVMLVGAACGSGDNDDAGAQPLPSLSVPIAGEDGVGASGGSGGGGTNGGGGGTNGGSGGPTSATPGPTPTDSSTCWTSELTGSVLGSEGAAGTVYLDLALTNSSGRTCTVRGFPGVSFVDAQGRQLGAAADRSGPAGESISLAPGEKAVAALGVTQPGVLPGCDSGQTAVPANVLIYPPDNRDPLRVAVPNGPTACSDPAVHQLKIATLETVE